ncbi:MAG: alpha/beta hydrolase [Nocardioides sp.]
MSTTIHQANDEIVRYLALTGADDEQWTDVAAIRRLARRRAIEAQAPPARGVRVEDIAIDGIATRSYRPASATEEAVVWVHGGGWVHGDLDSYDGLCRDLAVAARCLVLAVDYRLAPEAPFPAGLDDVVAVLRWAGARYASVAVAGDSAGGNLAAATCLRARDLEIEIAHQVLVYPVLDHADTDFTKRFREEYESFAGRHGFGREAFDRIAWLWDQYDPGHRYRDLPLASPLRAHDLSGLPPATVILAEHDVLRGDGEEYARRLSEAGVPTRLEVYDGQIHGFFQLTAVTPDARSAIDVAATELRASFDRRTSTQPSAREPQAGEEKR